MSLVENDPHEGRIVLQRGQTLEKARAAMLMVHGGGASAQDILTLADDLAHSDFNTLDTPSTNRN